MYCIKIAGLVIGIRSISPLVRVRCRHYRVRGEKPDFVVKITLADLRRESSENQPVWSFWAADQALHRAITNRLPEYDAFLLHAAAIAAKKKAYLFSAPSGTGKTTHILQWKKVYGKKVGIINGDKPIMRFIDGVLYACGNPWQGSENVGRNVMVPVSGLCFLKQSKENRICRLSTADALGRIFHQIMVPKEEAEFDRVLDLVTRAVEQVPCWLLECRPDEDAARLARETMEAAYIQTSAEEDIRRKDP